MTPERLEELRAYVNRDGHVRREHALEMIAEIERLKALLETLNQK